MNRKPVNTQSPTLPPPSGRKYVAELMVPSYRAKSTGSLAIVPWCDGTLPNPVLVETRRGILCRLRRSHGNAAERLRPEKLAIDFQESRQKSSLKSNSPSSLKTTSKTRRPYTTNGCGDFHAGRAANTGWISAAIRNSTSSPMNIDSVFCYAAHYHGARELVLEDPMRIYHIEHATGSGWTPEGQAQLFQRLAAKGIGFVSYGDVSSWAEQMRPLQLPPLSSIMKIGASETLS